MEQITDTGIRGFLKWFATVQPGLYKKVAPKLPSATPQAFSDYHAGGWRVAGLSNSQAVAKLSGLGDTLPDITVTGASAAAPITYSGSSPLFDASGITVAAPPTIDVSTAANTGGESTGTTDLIGNIVKGISALYLTKQQANIQQQVVNTQLQRAALGLPPLPTSLNNLGVPMVNVGLSSGLGGGLAIAAAVGIGLVFFSKMFGGRSRK
jgi:hypothetical protein